MKRYWRLLSIVTVIVLTIGTYYISSASSFPEYMIEKESGNESEIAPIILQGYSEGPSGDDVVVTAKGSTFHGELSFFERINGPQKPAKIKQYEENYRSFMRGKTSSLASYYEDDETLTYVDITSGSDWRAMKDIEFAVELLNKDTNETTSFTIPIPNRENYYYVYIVDVQLVDDELKVITKNNSHSFDGTEVHLYSFDVTKKEISNEKTMFRTPDQDKDMNTDYQIIHETNQPAANDYVLFIKSVMEKVQSEGYEEETRKKELLVYNLKTNEGTTLTIPTELLANTIAGFDGTHIYFSEKSEDGLKVTKYNLESEKIENEILIPSNSDSIRGSVDHIVKVSNNKVYVLTVEYGNFLTSTITVADGESGKILYEGKIMSKDASLKNQSIYFHDIEIK